MTGPVTVRNGMPSFCGDMRPLKSVPREHSDTRGIVVLADAVGLQTNNLDDRAIYAKMTGSDIWYMTCVINVDDVFDGFLSNGEKLLCPYHCLKSDSVLTQAYEISDSCIPVLFIQKGEVLCRNGTKRISDVLYTLEDMGYYRNIVYDTDGSVGNDSWAAIRGDHPKTIPYLCSDCQDASLLDGLGFEDVVTDIRF